MFSEHHFQLPPGHTTLMSDLVDRQRGVRELLINDHPREVVGAFPGAAGYGARGVTPIAEHQRKQIDRDTCQHSTLGSAIRFYAENREHEVK